MGHSKSSHGKVVHSDTGQPEKDRNSSNKQPNPTSITNKAQVRGSKEITKIRAELNDIETKRKILRINKSRS